MVMPFYIDGDQDCSFVIKTKTLGDTDIIEKIFSVHAKLVHN